MRFKLYPFSFVACFLICCQCFPFAAFSAEKNCLPLLSVTGAGSEYDRNYYVSKLSPSQLKRSQVYFSRQGLAYLNGKVLDTSGLTHFAESTDGKLFILRPRLFNGRFTDNENEAVNNGKHLIKHNSFIRNVGGAGMVEFEMGRLMTVTASSGHFHPSWVDMYQLLKLWESQGLDLSDTQVGLYDIKPRARSVWDVKYVSWNEMKQKITKNEMNDISGKPTGTFYYQWEGLLEELLRPESAMSGRGRFPL